MPENGYFPFQTSLGRSLAVDATLSQFREQSIETLRWAAGIFRTRRVFGKGIDDRIELNYRRIVKDTDFGFGRRLDR